MAIRIERTAVDDLDGSVGDVGTYRFGLDGVEYEIELSKTNLELLRKATAPFIAAGRKLPNGTAKTASPGKQTLTAEIRQWWNKHEESHSLPAWRANGPIPRAVFDAYGTPR